MDQQNGKTSNVSLTRRIKQILKHVVLPVVCFVIVAAVAIILNTVPEPFQRGFFCDDQSIAYPFRPDTVSVVALSLWTILGPFIVIVCWELLTIITANPRPSKRRTLLTITHWTYRFLYGYALVVIFTTCLKIVAGRLRPDFLDVCRPNYSSIDCSRFVTNVTCLTTSQSALNYARSSFPSGHTSSSVYSATYVCMYLALRVPSIKLEFVKPILQSTALLLAAFCAISRVCDNKHHWQDVLAGAICGAAIALAIFHHHVTAIFGCHRQSSYSADMRNMDSTNQSVTNQSATEHTTRSLHTEKANSELALV